MYDVCEESANEIFVETMTVQFFIHNIWLYISASGFMLLIVFAIKKKGFSHALGLHVSEIQLIAMVLDMLIHCIGFIECMWVPP